ncbi:hypothetical protein GCM10027446_10700 [Angustibacter peucedani]
MTTQRFYRRRFLNRRGFHAGAYVIADCRVETYRRQGDADEHSVDGELVIADSGRIATLDFAASDEAAVRNALHKARLLRDVVTDFTAALERAADEWRRLERHDA